MNIHKLIFGPDQFSFSIYRGAKFSGFIKVCEQQPTGKEPLDVTFFDDVEIRFFTLPNQDEPEFSHTISGSTLELGGENNNELTFAFGPEETVHMHNLRVIYNELRFFKDDAVFVYQNGQPKLVNVPDGKTSNRFELTLDFVKKKATILPI